MGKTRIKSSTKMPNYKLWKILLRQLKNYNHAKNKFFYYKTIEDSSEIVEFNKEEVKVLQKLLETKKEWMKRILVKKRNDKMNDENKDT